MFVELLKRKGNLGRKPGHYYAEDEYTGGTMKRITVLLLILVMLLVPAGNLQANAAITKAARGQTATGWLTGVTYTSDGDNETVAITARNYEDYSVMELTNPRRIVLDVYNAAATGKQQVINANGKVINKIRYAQFDKYTARVVFDVNSEADYGIEKTRSGLLLYIGQRPETDNSQDVQENDATKKTIKVTNSFKIQYTPNKKSEDVELHLKNYKNYTIKRLTDPERLVINMPTEAVNSTIQQTNINGVLVETIKCEKAETKGADVTIGLNQQAQYNVEESSGKLAISLSKPEYNNITYHNNGDRVYFTLTGANLTKGDKTLERYYEEVYDDAAKMYMIEFKADGAEFGNGTLKINDDYIKTVDIRSDAVTGLVQLYFAGTELNKYFTFTRGSSGITSITVLRPAKKKDKLVVIDPGHGGSATGAVYKDIYEKNMNLNMALRLDALLKKKGIKTYMLREDDSYINNYERAYIANRLNASLYLSIHCNAMDDKNYGGTMTLYYPYKSSSKFTGYDFANIVQKKLLASLGTTDRLLRSRPDLIVLRETNMPAALAEIAFLTNETDRTNLCKAEFRQKAAQALSNAVTEALQKIN